MTPHKFRLGQSVQYMPDKLQVRTPLGAFKITRLLPPGSGDRQYRIKNAAEPYERIAQESQLVLA
jgi:hypothetical protein